MRPCETRPEAQDDCRQREGGELIDGGRLQNGLVLERKLEEPIGALKVSFSQICARWLFTVWKLTFRSWAISLLVLPSAIIRRMRCSVGVREFSDPAASPPRALRAQHQKVSHCG